MNGEGKPPVEKETSWLAEHMIELDLVVFSAVALVIALALLFLNGTFHVDMMGPESKAALSVGVACGFVGFFGCIVEYQFLRRKSLIYVSFMSLYALLFLMVSFVPHL